MTMPLTGSAAGVLERLQEPATAAAVNRFLDRLDRTNRTLDALTPLLDLAEQAPTAIAVLVDSLDELVRQAADAGIDVEKGAIQGAGAALRFGATMDAGTVQSIEALLRSDVLDPAALQVIGELGSALSATAASRPAPASPLALVRASRDPDVQRALGFLIEFGKRFGRAIGPDRTGRPNGAS